jgi:hypothetical protein
LSGSEEKSHERLLLLTSTIIHIDVPYLYRIASFDM